MKILFAIKTLKNAGGAERVLVEVANGLAGRGHDITVISYDDADTESFYPFEAAISWRRLGVGRTDRSAAPFETLTRMVILRRNIVALRPDIAVGFMTSMYVPLAFALAGASIPVIASEHTHRARYESHRLERILLGIVPHFVRTITVVSPDVMEAHPPSLQRRMVVVPNPVRIEVLRRADTAGREKPRKILLSVGRLIPSKDYAILIDAFARIAVEIPDWDLRIMGEGPLRGELQSRIAAHDLSGRIFLPGSRRDILREYEAAQLFVSPSRFESLGLSVLEALASGLPAVGFADCPGVNTLIRPGHNGVLAAGEDRPQALAGALLSLMSDPQRRQSLVPACFEMPPDFLPERVVGQWESLAENVGIHR